MSNATHMIIKGKYLCKKTDVELKCKVTEDWNKVTCQNCLLFRKIFEVKI